MPKGGGEPDFRAIRTYFLLYSRERSPKTRKGWLFRQKTILVLWPLCMLTATRLDAVYFTAFIVKTRSVWAWQMAIAAASAASSGRGIVVRWSIERTIAPTCSFRAAP